MRPTDLLLPLDRESAVPLQRQVFEALRAQILDGRLKAGTRLPPTRGLARALGIGRNTALGAYEHLLMEGYVEARAGGGTRVAALTPDQVLEVGRPAARLAPGPEQAEAGLSRRGQALIAARGPRPGLAPLAAFRPGQPAVERFPFDLWARLLAAAARQPRVADLGYGHGAGWPDLRAAIAAQVGAARGVVAEADQVIVTTGAQAGLALIADLLIDPGDPVWLEEPGYLGARAAFTAAGARIVPVPVDAQGLDVAEGLRRAPRPRLIYVTPSHQFPRGVTMSLPRRLALIEAAARAGAFVIEDDYDSEFRYAGRPLSSLQGLAALQRGPGVGAIYVGTFAKTLFPALRVGFVIVPPDLAEDFTRGLRATGASPPIQVQMALAQFLAEGHYAAHVRRMRVIYGARQARLLDSLRRHLGDQAVVDAPDGGMQVAIDLPGLAGDAWLGPAGLARDLALMPLSTYALEAPAMPGLHLGFAAVPERMMDKAVQAIAEILARGP